MKDERWAWFQRILSKLEQLPFIRTIPSRVRRQVIVGLIDFGAFFAHSMRHIGRA